MPPSTWLLTERLNAAKELLELTDLPMQQIALRTGLRNADSLRKHFSAAFGVNPSRYRQVFAHRIASDGKRVSPLAGETNMRSRISAT